MILDLCPYWTNPTTGGGPERVCHLCQSISRISEVTEVSFRPTLTMIRNGVSPFRRNHVRVNTRYSEIQVPHVPTMVASRAAAAVGLPQDLYISQSCMICAPREISNMATHASVVQVEHPWQFRYAQRLRGGGRPLILSTHNCETSLVSQEKKEHVPGKGKYAVDQVAALESHALRHADHVIAVSDEDIADFDNVLGVDIRDKATVVPNGVDCRKTKPPTPRERDEARAAIGAGKEAIALFLGTRHLPNIEAVRRIEKMMPSLENANIRVFIVGSAGEGMRSNGKLVFTGHVPDYRLYLRAADIALNPLATGSGTSLKALEYLAAGIPIVATAMGVRGLRVKNGTHAIVADLEAFSQAVISLSEDHQLRRRLADEGRRLAESEFDWEIISQRLIRSLVNLGFVEQCEEYAT